MATINMHMKFEIEIPKQTWLMLRKPCRLQTDGRTDRRMDGRTDKVNPVYPPSNFVGRGYNNITSADMLILCIAGHQQAWYWSHHFSISLIAKFMGPIWAHLGPTGPSWAPCWPHELCYLGLFSWRWISHTCSISMSRNYINTNPYWCFLKSIKYKVGYQSDVLRVHLTLIVFCPRNITLEWPLSHLNLNRIHKVLTDPTEFWPKAIFTRLFQT